MKEKKEEMYKDERWLPVVGYEGWYDVSDFGRVKRMKETTNTFVGKILKPQTDKYGYKQVGLCKNGGQKSLLIHRIVMIAFVGPYPEDGDKNNNYLENLEYVTQLENIRHAHRLGLTQQRGEKHPMSKLKEAYVHKIRQLLRNESQRVIGEMFGVGRTTISAIATGTTWAYLKEEEEK